MQPSTISTTPLDLQQILDRYACVFVELVGFPPSRLEDHHVPLLPGRFPKSRGNIVILFVVDRLSNYIHFCALNHLHTTSSVTQFFMDQIFYLHGIPSSIVSDCDGTFTEELIQWHDMQPKDATWEQLVQIQQQFPHLKL